MYVLRIFVASLLFLLTLIVAIDEIFSGRSKLLIWFSLFALTLAYLCWPKQARQQRRHQTRQAAQDDWIDGIDILEFLIEAPFRLLGWIVHRTYAMTWHQWTTTQQKSNHH